MTPAEALVERSTTDQGLPIVVTDTAVLTMVATVMAQGPHPRHSEDPASTGSIAATSTTLCSASDHLNHEEVVRA